MSNIASLILIGTIMFGTLGAVTLLSHIYSLNNIKSRTVGDGQHGTARWATNTQIKKTYKHLTFTSERWRRQVQKGKTATTPDGKELPQGIVVGRTGRAGKTTVMVDTDDVHALMIGAAGVGKTAYWLYPCIEYACASGMSFLSTDTKGDVMQNYGTIAKEYYGYQISVIDLRNPTRSNGNNLLHLVNKYMDLYQRNPRAITFTAIDLKKYSRFSMICYIGMGWCIVATIVPVYKALTFWGFAWLLAGGIMYTIGAVLYGIGSKVRYIHSIFHVFVVLASIMHFICILIFVI